MTGAGLRIGPGKLVPEFEGRGPAYGFFEAGLLHR
jgi:hypothetical protein